MDDLEKKKKEEKEKDRLWALKVRELKINRSKNRGDKPSNMTMPAEKKRKMDMNCYVRVIQGGEKQDKRNNRDKETEEKEAAIKKIKLTVNKEMDNIETEK